MAKDVAPLLQSPMAHRLLVYRLGCQIPIPGLNSDALLRLNGLLSVETVSIFALGVTPFLSALFVFEFIKLIVPPLSRWETAKPENTRRLSRYVYFAALVMAGVQARGVASALIEISGLIDGPEWEIPITITLVAGTVLLGWFGDQITARGLGNGFWLLVITPTLINLPIAAAGSVEFLRTGSVSQNALAAGYLFLAAATALVVVTAVTGRATTEKPGERSGFRKRLAAASRDLHRFVRRVFLFASGGWRGRPDPDRGPNRCVHMAAKPGHVPTGFAADLGGGGGANPDLRRRRVAGASGGAAFRDQRKLAHRRRHGHDEPAAQQGYGGLVVRACSRATEAARF